MCRAVVTSTVNTPSWEKIQIVWNLIHGSMDIYSNIGVFIQVVHKDPYEHCETRNLVLGFGLRLVNQKSAEFNFPFINIYLHSSTVRG